MKIEAVTKWYDENTFEPFYKVTLDISLLNTEPYQTDEFKVKYLNDMFRAIKTLYYESLNGT